MDTKGWKKFTEELPPCCGNDGESAYISKDILLKSIIDDDEVEYLIGKLWISWFNEKGIYLMFSPWHGQCDTITLTDMDEKEMNTFMKTMLWKAIE